MVCHTSVVNMELGSGVDVSSVYVHFVICYILFGVTGIPQIYCQLQWEVQGRCIGQYMCILLYVKVIWCNSIA